MTLLRLAYRPPLAQRRVLARPRCIRASGYKTRRDTVLQSSAATLAESSAPTAVSREFASQRSSLLQTSGCRGRHMLGNNHAGNASCSGATRRAADAVAALPRLLQQHAAHAVLESNLVKELKEHRYFDCEELFLSGLHSQPRAGCVRLTGKVRTDGIASCASAVFLGVSRTPVHFNAQTPYSLHTQRVSLHTQHLSLHTNISLHTQRLFTHPTSHLIHEATCHATQGLCDLLRYCT